MAIGYVLIRTAPSLEIDVFHELEQCADFKEVTLIFGEYDILTKIDAPDAYAINSVVLDVIRSMPGIELTETLMTFRF